MADPRMDWADAVMFGVEEDPVLRSVITLVILLDQGRTRRWSASASNG